MKRGLRIEEESEEEGGGGLEQENGERKQNGNRQQEKSIIGKGVEEGLLKRTGGGRMEAITSEKVIIRWLLEYQSASHSS